MDSDEKKIRHLEAIQGIINRMAQNSFALKEWSVVLVGGLLGTGVYKSDKGIALLAYLPLISFWILDGYFLWQEKLFRDLYDDVRLAEKIENKDFFTMDTSQFQKSQASLVCVIFSCTLVFFHGLLLAAILLVTRLMA